jgi:cephalosporin-C deacetylase
MPAVDRPLSELKNYRGINPKPADFDEFWRRALEELDATNPDPELVPVDPLGSRKVETFDLRFTGVGGARVYAKYLRPSKQKTASPTLLLFHNYSGNSGNWNDKLRRRAPSQKAWRFVLR